MTQRLQNRNQERTGAYPIADLIDIDRLGSFMEKFTAAVGVGTAVLDLDGNVLVACGWQDICTKFHRIHPDTQKRCQESDTFLANQLRAGEKYNVYACLNGMVDIAIPIRIAGQHIGNLFMGQFLNRKPDVKFFRRQARHYGFDVKEYLAALAKVPILTEEEARRKVDCLAELAAFISEAGLIRLRVQEVMGTQEQRIKERTRDLKDAQIATLNMMQDAEEARQQAEDANKELKAMLAELKRSNQELEQFAYVASHDLQEPLRMVASYTQLLQRRYQDKLDDDANDFIHFAVDGANRMKALIDDLLSYSRISTRGREFKPTDINKVIENAASDLQMLIEEEGATLSWDAMPTVMADEMQLVQLFQNLLRNAIKFRNDAPPEISVHAAQNNGEWVFSVSDNGIGIEEQYFERIFIIFQRLHGKEEFSGTGIGLAVCKKIVERHGGRIWVASQPGFGSDFYFSIPVAKDNGG